MKLAAFLVLLGLAATRARTLLADEVRGSVARAGVLARPHPDGAELAH